ncbi:hypothetical protein [Clostridium tertium]|uniref:hypothetical protein n=1 Tax=Clostridium tertium TaxID=1559 RepID=UPI0018AC11AB|nr:hypothetical protein [Clostridium tertium]
MGIGDILKERMDYFKISKEKLSEEALVDIEELDMILSNDITFNEIDAITLEFISQIVYCKPEYFIDKSIRDKDMVNACYNRGNSTPKSNKVKGILQSFTEDLAFLCELQGE